MQKEHIFWKTFFSLFASILGVIVLIFIGYFAYFSIQLKFGNKETVVNLTQTFDAQFSSTSNKKAPIVLEDWTNLIRPNNPTIGNDDAKITIISFIDFTCPYCKAHFPMHQYITQKYAPVVKIVFKHLPLTSIHEHAHAAAEATSCAGAQGKFWQYHDIVFNLTEVNEDTLYTAATSAGLNLEQFNTCFVNNSYMSSIEQDVNDAIEVGLRGTPTHIVNGEVIEGNLTQTEWDTLILKNLNN